MDALARLQDLLPAGAVTSDPAVLRERGHDLWALSLLHEARGQDLPMPSAVAFPSSTDEVAAVLRWADETGTPIIPRGGGSGVCGGVAAASGSVVLDLSRMDTVLAVDQESLAVHVQAGVRGDRLEEALEGAGLTVGHYPQSLAISSVGGWIAASSAGQGSAGYGAIEDMVLGLTAVLAGGGVVRLRPVPRSAAGPDLRRLLVGSEGTLAVVTEAVLACSPRPRGHVWDCFRFEPFQDVMAALKAVVRSEAGPIFVRGYDATDSLLNFGRLGHTAGCVAILGFDQDLPGLEDRRRVARKLAEASHGAPLDEEYGRHWMEHRNDAVETYRRIMGPERTFGPGVIVDTMEVAALWSQVPNLDSAVRDALSSRSEAVGCHLSHVYPSGSSLYYTFLIRGADDAEAEATYLAAWEKAIRACLEAGGTLTHHHGVGRLKSRYLPEELGQEGCQLLLRIKQAVDPSGVLNPGALLG